MHRFGRVHMYNQPAAACMVKRVSKPGWAFPIHSPATYLSDKLYVVHTLYMAVAAALGLCSVLIRLVSWLQFIIALLKERPSSSTDRILHSTEFINPAELAIRILLVRKDLAVQVAPPPPPPPSLSAELAIRILMVCKNLAVQVRPPPPPPPRGPIQPPSPHSVSSRHSHLAFGQHGQAVSTCQHRMTACSRSYLWMTRGKIGCNKVWCLLSMLSVPMTNLGVPCQAGVRCSSFTVY